MQTEKGSMSQNTNQNLLDEYNYKINISAYENLTERERHIHQSAFMTGYKLGQEHTIKSKTITKFIYVAKGKTPNQHTRTTVYKTANRQADYIYNKVLRHYNRTHEEIISPRRLKEYAEVRSVIINLIRELTPLSLPEIGRMLGGRDHTTILHHLRMKFDRRRFWSVHNVTWKHYEKLYKDLEIELKAL